MRDARQKGEAVTESMAAGFVLAILGLGGLIAAGLFLSARQYFYATLSAGVSVAVWYIGFDLAWAFLTAIAEARWAPVL